ncbi:MAG: sulfatase-like hydrolase/transferase [Alistipes senegalensis]
MPMPPSSLSTPSRYSILTGRYSWRTTLKKGVGFGYSGPMITEGRRTVASMLSDNGYNTACIGKWHLGWNWTKKAGAKNGKGGRFQQTRCRRRHRPRRLRLLLRHRCLARYAALCLR